MDQQPKTKNQVIHDAINTTIERLKVLIGNGCSIVLLSSWPNDSDEYESHQSCVGNYFAQEGMVHDWLEKRKFYRKFDLSSKNDGPC